MCECGSAYVSVSRDGTLCKSVSGGTFPVIDKNKLRYLGKKEKMFWTFSTLGAGPQHALYFKAEVSCFELNMREKPLKRYTTKDYDYIFVQDWGDRTSDCGYKYTVTKGPYPHCAFHTKEELNEYPRPASSRVSVHRYPRQSRSNCTPAVSCPAPNRLSSNRRYRS